ncbi:MULTISPECIES: RNA polymerase sigma-70 factor [Olivibacter]|jgi:RNA polymerase sigma-70 factor (ECF subfamily)|uniref:RNA polymerase sigma-70 factor n=1 Tax=Olivibacter oleidegradans TaxID=760123 RepID=A0ABV6HIW0_9SPHI|nr:MULTISPECIES: RNA polymerase sigma-70 factor [Olivibacter]MDM8176688.1 RNA polymerase sigma-70 factor [Olivibacter sp. 47]QEL00512.1 RNA polymerase sigma-70 factor [Olivibacter sp. LS-1]
MHIGGGQCNLGDNAVFERTYKTYYAALRFFATKYVGDDESEDIIESLFLRLWKQKKVLTNETHLKAFLYQATRNACLDFIKTQGRIHKRHSVWLDQCEEVEQDYLHDLIHTEVLAELYRAIQHLPSQCKHVMQLGFVEGLTNEEIAQSLDLSVQTVKNHKVRALRMLKKQFAGSVSGLLFIHLFLS